MDKRIRVHKWADIAGKEGYRGESRCSAALLRRSGLRDYAYEQLQMARARARGRMGERENGRATWINCQLQKPRRTSHFFIFFLSAKKVEQSGKASQTCACGRGSSKEPNERCCEMWGERPGGGT